MRKIAAIPWPRNERFKSNPTKRWAPVMESHSKSARRRANLSSLSLTYLKQAERICAGMHMADVPEARSGSAGDRQRFAA